MNLSKALNILYPLMALLGWLLLLYLGLIEQLQTAGLRPLPPIFKPVSLTVFLAFLFLTFRSRVRLVEGQANSLLRSLFYHGLLLILVQLTLKALLLILQDSPNASHPRLLASGIYTLQIGVTAYFYTRTFFVFKCLVLFRQSLRVRKVWAIFEVMALFSLVYLFDIRIPLHNPHLLSMGLLGLIALVMAFNLKWVAYQTFREKLEAIMLLVLVILTLSGFYQLTAPTQPDHPLQVIAISENVYLFVLFFFIGAYALISLLVIIFNLPTSSVVERKIQEASTFQELSDELSQSGKEEEVYDILLDRTLQTAHAQEGLLEVFDDEGQLKSFIARGISNELAGRIKMFIDRYRRQRPEEPIHLRRLQSQRKPELPEGLTHRSLVAMELKTQNQQLGQLVVLKQEDEGVDREAMDIMRALLDQAASRIQNFRLKEETAMAERYKKEMEIARQVQNSLVPKKSFRKDWLSLSIHSRSASEVGGDYYDYLSLSEDLFAVVIGDVSGKGTSAAFHMAQMKGIFHSLIQTVQDPQAFMVQANRALSRCLEPKSFITLELLIFDRRNQQVTFARAGHPAPLFSSGDGRQTRYLESPGMGLGLQRSDRFAQFIEKQQIQWESGDRFILFTDGIPEARNANREQFGFERVREKARELSAQDSEQAVGSLVQEVDQFCQGNPYEDDTTLIVIDLL